MLKLAIQKSGRLSEKTRKLLNDAGVKLEQGNTILYRDRSTRQVV